MTTKPTKKAKVFGYETPHTAKKATPSTKAGLGKIAQAAALTKAK